MSKIASNKRPDNAYLIDVKCLKHVAGAQFISLSEKLIKFIDNIAVLLFLRNEKRC